MEFLAEKLLKDKLHYKKRFAIIFLITLFAHLYVMTNLWPNYDSLGLIVHNVDCTTFGRWSLKYLCLISGNINVPYLNGMLAVIYLSLAAVLIGICLEIKNDVIAIVVGAVFTVYPTVASTFTFTFILDGFTLGLLLCIISCYLFKTCKWYLVLAGSVLLAIGMGAYQSNLSMAGVVYAAIIFRIAYCQYNKKKLLKTALFGIVGAALGCVFYWIALGRQLGWNYGALSDYQGVNEVGKAQNFSYYLSTIKQSYKDYEELIFQNDTNGYRLIKIAVIFILVTLLGAIMVKSVELIKNKNWVSVVALALCILINPLLVYCFRFVSSGVGYYGMMVHSAVGIWLLFAVLLDSESAFQKSNMLLFSKAVKELGLISMLCLVFTYFIIDMQGYMSLNMQFNKSYALALKISDRIEQIDDGSAKYIYIETVKTDGYNCYGNDLAGKVDGAGGGGIVMYTSGGYNAMIREYVGTSKDYMDASPEMIENIKNCEEYKSMPSWPCDGSVKNIDGVIVVKGCR